MYILLGTCIYIKIYCCIRSSVSYSPGLIVQPPTSTVVYSNTQAVFTCEVMLISVYVWFINGTDGRALSSNDADIKTADDGLTKILILRAKTLYNNTIVQYEAAVIGGSGFERSDNVTLTIQGTCIYIKIMYMYVLWGCAVCYIHVCTYNYVHYNIQYVNSC